MDQITILARLSLVLCLAITTACAGKRPMPGDVDCKLPPPSGDIIRTLNEIGTDITAVPTQDAQTMANSAQARPLRYLALSGGGEDGAFGAGFLKGWAAVDEPRGELPEFDIVTGVSTGALIATFAFIGDPEPLKIYTEVDDNTLTSRRPLLIAAFSDALYKNGKLKDKVNEIIRDDVLTAVAERARMGRKLRVGAVNLDTNEFQQFALGQIAVKHEGASSDEERAQWRKLYVEAVVASTAIPVVFQPSYINCNMYVDGGARQQIFLEAAIEDLKAARAQQMQIFRTSKKLGKPPAGPEIYAIINGNPTLVFEGPAENSVIGIGGRSVRTLLNANLHNDLRHICGIDTDIPIQLTDIGQIPPATVQDCEDVREDGKLFPQAYMNCLYDAAVGLWGPSIPSVTPWKACP